MNAGLFKKQDSGNGGRIGKLRVTFNAPVTLTFVIVCFAALILSVITGGFTNQLLFSVYRSSLLSPFTYVRFFGHVIGHADWSHLIGNMMTILILGPLLEEKYGSSSMLVMMISTAFVTGVASFVLFPNVQLLGASGIVFAMILLSSFTSVKDGEIPLTFILVAVLYLGEQVYYGILLQDSISNSSHIIGGICGAAFGWLMNLKRPGNRITTDSAFTSDTSGNTGSGKNTYY